MTVSWLRKVLDKMGNEDAQVFIDISGTMFPLCGKVDRSILTYENTNAPGVRIGETVLTLRPCECSNETEDNNKADNTLLN